MNGVPYAGLILWGFGVWWLLMTASLLGTHWGRLPFNMGWWAFIFPMGIYCAATDTLAKLTGVQFFQVCSFLQLRLTGLSSARDLHAGLNGCPPNTAVCMESQPFLLSLLF